MEVKSHAPERVPSSSLSGFGAHGDSSGDAEALPIGVASFSQRLLELPTDINRHRLDHYTYITYLSAPHGAKGDSGQD
jgi:hypothetical protein